MHISIFMDYVVAKLEKLATSKYRLAIIGLMVITIILINGISLVPDAHYQRLSQNPFVTRTDISTDNYWQETILLPLLAFFLRMNTPVSFSILCFAIIIGAFALFSISVFQKMAPLQALISLSMLLSSPLTTVLLSWVGTADGLTFLLTIPFLFVNSGALLFILSMLGITNHVSFTIAALEILGLRFIAHDKIEWRHLVCCVSGSALGYFFAKLFLAFYNIQVMTRFNFILNVSLDMWLYTNLKQFPMTIFSFFNIQWLILPVCFIMFYKRDRVYYTFLAGMLLLNYVITFFSFDSTRVFSLLSWGMLMQCIFHSFQLSKESEPAFQNQWLKALVMIGAVAFFTPRYYSWGGTIYPAPFSALIGLLKK